MFNASIPVTAGGFYDRAEDLEKMSEVARSLTSGDPRWICLLGPRKIGKTSLLLEVARRMAGSDLVFATLDAFEDLPVSVEIFRRYALRALDAALGKEIGVSLEALGGRPEEFRAALLGWHGYGKLPASLRTGVAEIPGLTLDRNGLRFVLDLPERLADALGIYVVAAWDEFQEIAAVPSGRWGHDLLPFLRSAWQRHRRVSYVVSGSARTMLRKLATDPGSPFFQHFTVMELGPFSRDDSIRLLTEGAPASMSIPKSVAAEAYEVIGGHPFYLQVLGEALAAQRSTAGPSIREALGAVLFSRTGRLALYFENEFARLVGRASSLAATLEALASGPRRLTEIAVAIGAKSGATAGYLGRLGDAVARGEDGRYRLTDPVFGLWLRWRAPGGTVVPMTLLGDEAEKKVAEALARMGFDLVYQSRASRGAFDVLAVRGPRQLGLQVKRSAIPVRLPRTAWKRMEADAERLGWLWAIAVLTPEEEVLFLDPARVRRGKMATLHREASIDNLLAWVDREGRRRR